MWISPGPIFSMIFPLLAGVNLQNAFPLCALEPYGGTENQVVQFPFKRIGHFVT